MKASELMRGNIVLYEYERQKTPARVVEIYRNSVLVEDISGEYDPIEIDEDKIFPVEPTPEILDKQEQLEMDLEEFTEKMDAWKARYNHPDNIPIKAAMAFTARMFYQYPNIAREWYDSLPKATQD